MTLHVAVSGASGLIGTMLRKSLAQAGHRVTALVRRAPEPGEIRWDPAGSGLDPASLRGVDAVIHLAGENLAEGRWTEDRKREILESRKLGTRLLAEAMAGATAGPRTLVSASAIGYYGDRGEEELTESSSPGTGFLPEVCVAWEAATAPATEAGIRVVRVRTGLLLTPAGGLLQRILLPFRLFAGGRLGDGQQWMSWISAMDLLRVYRQALEGDLAGPVNAVAPVAVRNEEFTRVLARVLHRPAVMVVPRTALQLAYGQMADEAILASTHVLPTALQSSGFGFQHPTLEPALQHLLRAQG
ncbi:MAG TPA: TIGR01777 family oxidoreductase [Gemmatimonadales bacterium]|nr:TIGR01777 family oxidoreductase [Gemmatimonadales bacterium]